MSERPICHIVAGSNGSGKSTFTPLSCLSEHADAVEYIINPYLMAQGMSTTDIRQELEVKA